MSAIRVAAFAVVLGLVMALLHWYAWLRLGRDTELRGRARKTLRAGLALLAGFLPASVIAYWGFPGPLTRSLTVAAFVWLGAVFYLVLLFGGLDSIRLTHWVLTHFARGRAAPRPAAGPGQPAECAAPSSSPPDAPLADAVRPHPALHSAALQDAALQNYVGRRVIIARAMAGIGSLGTAAVMGHGLYHGLDIETPEVGVKLNRLPRELDGYRIALLSDVHIGPTLGADFLRGVVTRTNELRPDLIAIAGDLVDGSVEQIGATISQLANLRARHGVFFVTGNHEYYSGAAPWIRFLHKLGVQVLTNTRTRIGDAAASFDLAGVPDRHAGRSGASAANAALAVRGRDPERELVFLAHQPVQIEQVQQTGAGLQLSGHTHGGQLYPFGALTLLAQPYLAGLYRHNAQTQIYVSRGTGLWGPPMRVLAPAEITTLVLHT